jgi:type VI secretion system protein ImpL
MKAVFKFLFHPALSSLLGLVALILLIWFVGPLIALAGWTPLQSELARGILIALVLVFVGLRLAWRKWKANKNNAQLVAGLLGADAAAADGKATASEGLDKSNEVETLRNRFEKAIRVLKDSQAAALAKKGGLARLLSFGSGRYLYELPWYVFIGAPGSGKTTALVNSGLHFPLAEKLGVHQLKGVGGTRNCDWWFTDEAVLIDTAGRYTTQDSEQAVDRGAWQGFLGLLKRHRPRQPLNGVLLTVSPGDLLAQGPEAAGQHATVLRARVQELYAQLNVRLPIYVLVTKADLIAGFNEFFSDFGKEARDQVWGVTFPAQGDAAAALASLPDELERLRGRVLDLLPVRLRDEHDLVRRGAIAAFDQQLAAANRLLDAFLGKVFAPSGFDHALMLRGVYFTSGTQEGNPIDRVMSSLGAAFGLERHLLAPQAGSGKSFFLTRLLREVVFAEQGLGGTNLKWEFRRSLVRLAAFAGIGVLTVGSLLAWAASYYNNDAYIQAVDTRVEAVQPLVVEARVAASDDVLGILPVLEAVRSVSNTTARLPGEEPLSMRFGLSQGDKLDAAAQQAYRGMLRDVLLPRIAQRVEAQLRVTDPDNPEFTYEALKSYIMLHDTGHFDAEALKAWIALDWEINLPRETTLEQRAALAGYLTDLFKSGPVLSPVPADTRLMELVRRQLLRYPLPERVYSRLKRQGVGDEFPEFTVERVIGPSASLVFARRSGQPLSLGVSGLYSFDGYHKGFDPKVEHVSQRLAEEEPWVLALPQPDVSSAGQISREVRRLYLNDYVRLWDAFIGDITTQHANNLSQSVQITRALSAADSPLPKLLKAVSHETTLIVATEDKPAVGVGAITEARSELGRMVLNAATQPGQTAPRSVAIENIVDEHFTALRQFVSGEGSTAPVNTALQLINDVYVYLSATETALRDKLPPPPSDVIARVKADGPRTPEPVQSILGQLSTAGTSLALNSLRASLSSAVAAQVGQFCKQATDNRYPFVRSSARDVARDDFVTLFGPGGKFDTFFNQSLAQYVDTTTNPWTFHKVQEQSLGASGNLVQFQRAAVIRDVFFSGGGRLRLDLKPIEMDPPVTRFTLDVDGQRVTYAHGPQVPQSVQWPGPQGGVQTRMEITPPGLSGTSGVVTNGPWALFRMLDKANIKPGKAPERFRATFTVDGRSAVFEVTTNSVRNPFRLRELVDFRCPDKL